MTEMFLGVSLRRETWRIGLDLQSIAGPRAAGFAFVERHSLFNISSPNQTQKSVFTKERLWELGGGGGAGRGQHTLGGGHLALFSARPTWAGTSSGHTLGSPTSESGIQPIFMALLRGVRLAPSVSRKPWSKVSIHHI